MTSTPKIDNRSLEVSFFCNNFNSDNLKMKIFSQLRNEYSYSVEPVTPFLNPTVNDSLNDCSLMSKSMNAFIEPFDYLIPNLNHEQCTENIFTDHVEDYLYSRLMCPIDNYCLDKSSGIFRDCMYSS